MGILDWFKEDEHPRAPKGSAGGGKFAKKGSGGGGGGGGGSGGGKADKNSEALAYDPKTNTGTGYNTPGGDKRVKALQSILNRLGLTDGDGKPLKVDGKLGPKTTGAIKKMQQRLGLKPDGRVTPALLVKLAATKALTKRGAAVELCLRAFDFDARPTDDGRTLEGYAAVFNTPTRIRDAHGEFEETILRGAFTRSLAARQPVLQWDHGRDPSVGTAPIGDIQDLREDDKGLFVRARLYDHPSVERVRMAIAGKSVKGMSFRFGVPEKGDTWTERDGQPVLREIRDADVHELGPVVFPAYDATTVSVRSLLAGLDPDERRALVRELAAEVRLAMDLSDLVGQPGPERPDGDEHDVEPSSGRAPANPHLRQRLDEGALRARGILK